MRKLAIVLENLGPSQISHAFISSANHFLEKFPTGYDIVAFTKNVTPIYAHPNFSVMNLQEAFDYDGILITTDLSTTARVLNFPGPAKKIFYVWDLDWLSLRNSNSYETLRGLYTNSDLIYIARSKEHKELLELTWGTNVSGIVEDCNVEQIFKLLESTDK